MHIAIGEAVSPKEDRFHYGGRVLALDGVRAVAIVLVIVSHAARNAAGFEATGVGRFVDTFGHLGVDIFFVLSGFLITTLLLRELAAKGSIDLAKFYERRLRRILPAYWLFLAVIGTLAITHAIDVPLRVWLMNAFYLSDYTRAGVWWTGHTWSLAIEEQFYLLWPAILIAFGVTGAQRFAVTCICAIPVIRLATYLSLPGERSHLSVMLHTRMDVLMVGCLLAILISQGRFPLGWTKGASSLAFGIASSIVIGGLLIDCRFGAAYKMSIGYTLTAIAIATSLVLVIARPESLLARFLRLRPVAWLGRISYSLYLWQQVFLTPLNHTVFGRFPINVISATAVASASFYFIEGRFYRARPLQILLPAWRAGPDPAVAPQPSLAGSRVRLGR